MLKKISDMLLSFFREDNIGQIVTIVLLIICILLFLLKANYFNVIIIVKNHLKQFVTNRGSYDKSAFGVAFIIPLLLAIVTIINENEISIADGSFINAITLIITILTALFFTIIGLVLDIKIKIKESSKNATEKVRLNELCESVYKTNMFQILVCIILLLLCFVNMSGIFDSILLRGGIYYLSYLLLINIMMLLKRLYVLMNEFM